MCIEKVVLFGCVFFCPVNHDINFTAERPVHLKQINSNSLSWILSDIDVCYFVQLLHISIQIFSHSHWWSKQNCNKSPRIRLIINTNWMTVDFKKLVVFWIVSFTMAHLGKDASLCQGSSVDKNYLSLVYRWFFILDHMLHLEFESGEFGDQPAKNSLRKVRLHVCISYLWMRVAFAKFGNPASLKILPCIIASCILLHVFNGIHILPL